MAAAGQHSSHIRLGEINIIEEQKEIDRLVKLLLEFKPKKKASCGLQNQNSSPGKVQTPKKTPNNGRSRGPGRPPRNKGPTTTSSSPAVRDSMVESSDSCNLPTFELLIECIEKLNNQNKVLMNKVSELDTRVQDSCLIRQSSDKENSSIPETSVDSSPTVTFKSVAEKVEKLENNLNSRLSICRGPTVTRKIASHSGGSTVELEKIKAELCIDICGTDIAKISVDAFDVSVFGKNRDSLKIECNNLGVKKFLLHQVRQKKPSGIYLVEFLSGDKRKIHNSLVSLRKENPAIIKAVYVRGGSVYGKIGEDTLKFESLNDVEATKTSINSSSTTESTSAAQETTTPPADGDRDGCSQE